MSYKDTSGITIRCESLNCIVFYTGSRLDTVGNGIRFCWIVGRCILLDWYQAHPLSLDSTLRSKNGEMQEIQQRHFSYRQGCSRILEYQQGFLVSLLLLPLSYVDFGFLLVMAAFLMEITDKVAILFNCFTQRHGLKHPKSIFQSCSLR